MFQDFDDDESGGGSEKLAHLRARMAEIGIDAFLCHAKMLF